MSSMVKSSERLLISTKKAKGSNKELHMSKPADDAKSTLHISSASAPVPDPSTSHSLSQVIVPDADDIFSHEANESDENSTNNNYSLNITVRVAENNDSIHYHGEEGIKSNGGASREDSLSESSAENRRSEEYVAGRSEPRPVLKTQEGSEIDARIQPSNSNYSLRA
ncbi:uncharacterized protein RAG0_07217 [Rhynchosporium agropyri]|uniref:Uncharacterized protein n=1 Tax=Rhynchosporium agropyri TaxID=914238 RepID=A0A1E1KKI7_9HELO|nr:uncharacterized protein RAG0_07217 [Rhynchosporium agropyri]